jgi:hypothetical protein
MKEISKLPAFTAFQRRIAISLGPVLCLSIWICGCTKKTVPKQTPQAILNAKTASLDELLHLISSYNEIRELSSSDLKLTLEHKKIKELASTASKSAAEPKGSEEEWVRWRSAPGYILLKRPDSVRLALRSPLGTEFEMSSVGDDLSAWIPSKNRFYIGANSAKELVAEGFSIPIRGPHIFNAILPKNFDPNSSELRISMEEAKDDEFKYYIISFYKDAGSRRIRTLRRIWIERSELAIRRQIFFLEDGQVESDIRYLKVKKTDGFSLPSEIHLDRPLDGYNLKMEFKSWRINGGLDEKAFALPVPRGAEIIHLAEKPGNGAL